MTAKELASLSCEQTLIEAMNDMASQDSAVCKAYCRCGSRLPWTECHAAEPHTPFAEAEELVDGGRICWRYSPLAPCFCHLTRKTYFDCCWQASVARYKDDASGELVCTKKMKIEEGNDEMRDVMLRMHMAKVAEGEDANGLVSPGLDEYRRFLSRPKTSKDMADGVRRLGMQQLIACKPSTREKTKIDDWDIEVYAGCVERIVDPFFWTDIHWEVPKAELLEHTKEWNEALEKYCDDVGLTGSERTVVVEKHTAIPLAPCANLSCDKRETQVKEFRNCAKCKSVGYCSRECQANHWKIHKKVCIHK